ncbi:NAD(P)-dependent oxidoreductase [Acidobacteria bacterium AH-259-D05]|nr:NAD(P)-dependent oxidoreductase [Acidobacteria bacterium AH-259-D05]
MTTRKILITGGAGMLATDLAANLSTQPGYEVVTLPRAKLDVTCSENVEAVLEAHRPDILINTAVMHVDDSEGAPEKAFAINAWGARTLAQACRLRGAVMVQISTGGLFGDEVLAYHEYDSVVLKTVYARSKYAGEQYVRQFLDRYFILRLGWLYGGSLSQPKNFVAARYREATQNPLVKSARDKHGSPTYSVDAARAIRSLLETDLYGLYHIANQGGCSRAEYVRTIVQAFGLDTPVEAVDSGHFPRKAQVPDCEILTSYNLGFCGLPLLRPWQEALACYVRGIRDEIN